MPKLTDIPGDERTIRQIMLTLAAFPELRKRGLRRKIAEKVARIVAARALRVASAFLR